MIERCEPAKPDTLLLNSHAFQLRRLSHVKFVR
jgi:hypothetical protein